MSARLQRFVAEELWLLIAVVTLPLMMLLDTLGPELFAEVAMIVGWFMLTPLFLFWGGDIAGILFADESRESDAAESATEDDAIAELKRRYAEGEIDEVEFERRLDRLVALDEADPDIQFPDSPGVQRSASRSEKRDRSGRESEIE